MYKLLQYEISSEIDTDYNMFSTTRLLQNQISNLVKGEKVEFFLIDLFYNEEKKAAESKIVSYKYN